jgi:hypothetical protein
VAEQVAQALQSLSGGVQQQRQPQAPWSPDPNLIATMPFAQAQEAVFSDPQHAATLQSIGGLPPAGAVEPMGAGSVQAPFDMWNEGRPVSDGAPWDQQAGQTYAQRHAFAQAALEQQRAKRPKVTPEEKARIRDVVLANRARQRGVRDERKARAETRVPRHIQYAQMRNAMRPGRSFGRNDLGLLSLMQRAQSDQADRRFGQEKLSQDQRQFETDMRLKLAQLAMGQQQGQQELGAQQQQDEARNRIFQERNLLDADPTLAPYMLPPEIRQQQQQETQERLLSQAQIALRGEHPTTSREEAIQELQANGIPQEQISELVRANPPKWQYDNFIGGPLSQSPQGTRYLTNPNQFMAELMQSIWGK